MPTHLVNLEALITREDFESSDESSTTSNMGQEVRIDDFEDGRPYASIIRKPDFQRSTTNWSASRISEFVKSVVDAELIPAIILWRSPLTGNIFVIDGAHRLSALIAWVRNDYGNGPISRLSLNNNVPPTQMSFDEQTRALIDAEVGSYEKLRRYSRYQHEAPDELTRKRAQNLLRPLAIQRVEGGTEAAENSFFKINGNPAIIDPTELGILKARRKPNAIATRAIINAGRGHKYWRNFAPDIQSRIEATAAETYNLLFTPILQSDVQKTLDVPIAGRSYSGEAFKMVFDLVNMVNLVTPSMWEVKKRATNSPKKPTKDALADDSDGQATMEFLERVRRSAQLISGTQPRSLGLHPMVYFHGATGKFLPSTFLAVIRFMSSMEAESKLFQFTAIRSHFERFLTAHRDFVNQVSHSKGSRTRPVEALVTMYRILYEQLSAGVTEDSGIVAAMHESQQLKDIRDIPESEREHGKRFTQDVRQLAYIRDALPNALRCSICSASLHANSMSADHDLRVEDGGLGGPENLGWSHPYCNTGYKERLNHESRRPIATPITDGKL